jgi:hypothetical protein
VADGGTEKEHNFQGRTESGRGKKWQRPRKTSGKKKTGLPLTTSPKPKRGGLA